MKIELGGINNLEYTADLLSWLHDDGIIGVSFSQEKGEPKSGTMGHDFLPIIIASTPIITAIANSTVLIEIVKTINAWRVIKKFPGTLKFNDISENSFDVPASNAFDAEKIVGKILKK